MLLLLAVYLSLATSGLAHAWAHESSQGSDCAVCRAIKLSPGEPAAPARLGLHLEATHVPVSRESAEPVAGLDMPARARGPPVSAVLH